MQTKQSILFDLPSSFLWRRAKYQVLLYALEWCFGVKSDHTKKRSPQQHVWHDSQTGLFSRMITLKRSWAGMYAQFEACVFLITCIFCGCCNNIFIESQLEVCVRDHKMDGKANGFRERSHPKHRSMLCMVCVMASFALTPVIPRSPHHSHR